ncbi:MAG: ABC transporter substrate-binding protein [Burkholderiales bacterium]|nr:ABC transporter substrate-binding protein [Burkholderiales bacterium]
MQRRRVLWVLLTALLYFAPNAIATRHALAQTWQMPQIQGPPSTQEPEEPATEFAPVEERSLFTQDHIGVILPLQSNAYRRLAEQVRLGILTASNMATSYRALPVNVYSTDADTRSILEAYERAIRESARVIIGPLTRDGVSAVAERALVSVPTIALNVPNQNIALPRQMFVFGLQIESEAEQLAKLAFRHGGRKALLVVSETALSQRIARAFTRQWKALKGDIADEFVYSTDAVALAGLRELLDATAADVAFLAVNAPRARFIRAYLGTQFPIYATSLVYASRTDKLELYDLDGVRFMDMPWLLQEDHPAVMTYLRTTLQSSALDEERFYALGIDAYRISQALLQNAATLPKIDGVTGIIKLNEQQRFTHELTPAFFSYGTARLLTQEPGKQQ